MEAVEPEVVTAGIAVFVSILTILFTSIFKIRFDTWFHAFKLRADHQYEQRRKIKEAISKHKIKVLDAGETLNHRFWNFSKNCNKGWHKQKNNTDINDEDYYLLSFCYRFLSFFAWCRTIEKEMVFLDSTISDSNDLEFIKYLKLFPHIFCDVVLFEGRDYDNFHSKDHFFKDNFLHMVDSIITDEGVLSFSDFKTKSQSTEYVPIISYISNISQNQSCQKWYVMHFFHFLLVAFLTKYGYGFQKTSEDKLRKLALGTPKNELLVNLPKVLDRYQLNKVAEIKAVLKVLKEV